METPTDFVQEYIDRFPNFVDSYRNDISMEKFEGNFADHLREKFIQLLYETTNYDDYDIIAQLVQVGLDQVNWEYIVDTYL